MPRFASAVLLLLVFVPIDTASGQRLPVRTYTTADGLAGDDVRDIVQDTRGFLWIATSSGLSRFDGREFRTYGMQHGLPHPSVHDVLQDAGGTVWVATAGGLARLEPRAHAFDAVALAPHTGSVQVLHEDRNGTVWMAAGSRIMTLSAGGRTIGRIINLDPPSNPPHEVALEVETIAEGPDGALWVGTNWGLAVLRRDGRILPWRVKPSSFDDRIHHLAFDRTGRLWLTHWGIAQRPGVNWGVYALDPALLVRKHAARDGGTIAALATTIGQRDAPLGLGRPDSVFVTAGGPLGDARVHSVYAAADGYIWVATEDGVVRIGEDGVRRFGESNGLGAAYRVVAEDRHGTLWLGSRGAGLSRLDVHALVTYTEREGLRGREVTAIVEDRSGRLCVAGVTAEGQPWFGALDGDRVTPVTLRGPDEVKYWGWGWSQTLTQARDGEWWLPTGDGVLRYPSVPSCVDLANVSPKALYRRADGLSADDAFRLFEDSRGDIWISVFGDPPLHRWTRATATLEPITATAGLSAPTAFAEDRTGALWIGFYAGGLMRYRQGGAERWAAEDGVPAGLIEDLHVDASGRLWIAARGGGLARIDHPGATRPSFVRPTRAEGLAEGAVSSLVEDQSGRMFVATERGVLQFDADARGMRRLSTAEGLGSNSVRVSYCDRLGTVWFGTQRGLSKLAARQPPRPTPPPVFILGLRIAGVPRPVAPVGEHHLGPFEMTHSNARVEIEYGAASLATGDIVRYEAMLEGADREWQEAAMSGSSRYLNLAPGSYRFHARAVYADGRYTPQPATVAFTVLPPVWRQWWFIAAGVAALALAAWAVHRERVRRLVALERVRTRLATDLHDDLGARLSRMSILAEVARVRLGDASPDTGRILEDVGTTARELMHASSDIAWSIDPAHDDLRSLAARIRRFASDLLEGKGVVVTFEVAPETLGRRVPPDVRRHVLLVFQEALNNIVRHAHARRVTMSLAATEEALQAEIGDDGCGLAPAKASEDAGGEPAEAAYGGRGIENMRRRARELEGHLRIETAPGGGTRIRLTVPLR